MKTLKRYSLGKDGLPTAAAIKAYERDGVVCIENAFDPEWVSHGRRAVAAAISTAAKSALREDHVVNEGKGLFFLILFCGVGCLHSGNSRLNRPRLTLQKK